MVKPPEYRTTTLCVGNNRDTSEPHGKWVILEKATTVFSESGSVWTEWTFISATFLLG